MVKSTRALSGAAKDAFLKRAIHAEREIPAAVRDRLTARLQGEIALLSLKASNLPRSETSSTARSSGAAAESIAVGNEPSPLSSEAMTEEAECPPAQLAAEPAFDPYDPNVIVIIRTRGRDAVLDQLSGIADVEHLRLLAREQQLGIASDLASAADIRQAIVAAAERRIANRRAAAS